MKNFTITIALVLLLTACGGGGESSPPTTTPPPALVSPAGVWEGSVLFPNGLSLTLLGVVTPEGEARFFVHDYAGNIIAHQVANLTLSNGDDYTAIVKEYSPGLVEFGTLAGTYSDSHIDGAATFAGVQTSTFNLYKSIYSNAGASFDLIAGNYVDLNGYSLSVDSSGYISAQNGHCITTGQITIPDSSVNVYSFTGYISACEGQPATTITGLGALIPDNGYDVFIFEWDNGTVSAVGSWVK